MSEIGALSIRITADNSGAERGIRQTRGSLGKLGADVRKSANKWTKWGAASAAAALGVAAVMVRTQLQVLDELAKTSDALGIQQERLQALQLVADLTGTSAAQLSTNLERMQRNLGRAAREGGSTAKALEEMGVELDSIISLEPDRQLEQLAQALSGVENQAVKASIAQDLFGRDGVRMLKLMEQLKEDGLDPVVAELEAMGVAISRIDTRRIEEANDAMTRMQAASTAVWQRLAVESSPVIKAIADQMTELSKSSGGFGKQVEQAADIAFTALGFVGNRVQEQVQLWRLVRLGVVGATLNILEMGRKTQESTGRGSKAVQAFRLSLSTIIPTSKAVRAGLDSAFDMDGDKLRDFERLLDDLRMQQAELRHELEKGIDSRPFSERMKEWRDNAIAAMNDAVREAEQFDRVVFNPIETDPETVALIAEMRRALMNETELLRAEYDEQLSNLESARDERLNIIEQYNKQERELLEAQRGIEGVRDLVSDERKAQEARLAEMRRAHAEQKAEEQRFAEELNRISLAEMRGEDVSQQRAIIEAERAAWQQRINATQDAINEQLAQIERYKQREAELLSVQEGDADVSAMLAQLDAERQVERDRLQVIEESAQERRRAIERTLEAEATLRRRAARGEDAQALIEHNELAREQLEREIEDIQAAGERRLAVIEEFNERERQLRIVTQAPEEVQSEIDRLREEREAQLAEIESYNALEQQLEAEHQAAMNAIRQEGDMFSRDANEAWLQSLEERNRTAEEMEIERYEAEQERLRESLEQGLLTREEYDELDLERAQHHADQLNAIEEAAAAERQRIIEAEQAAIRAARMGTAALAMNLLDQFAGKSKAAAIAAIAINKGMAMAQAAQNTAVAVMRGYSIDPTGALSARIATMGKAQLALIAATGLAQAASVGSGRASTITSSGGLPAVRTTGGAGQGGGNPSQTFTINLAGSGTQYTADDIDELIRQINSRTSDGVVLRTNRG